MQFFIDIFDFVACLVDRPRPRRAARRRGRLWLACLLGLAAGWTTAAAQTTQTEGPGTSASAGPVAPVEAFSFHGQFTNVTQEHPSFTSPYQGANSLQVSEAAMETVDVTLFLGARLWRGGALYFNPEVDQGYGLSNTLGVAGFPSGEAYKVGDWTPYYRTQRLFLRQAIALGETQSRVESGANMLGGIEPDDRLTLTVGKFSVVDIFDTNAYAHDPRADFLNWSVVDSAAFDYAADSWGYTLGVAVEWVEGGWTLRGGYFALSTAPNVETIDTGFGQHSMVLEAERRFQFMSRPGAIRVLGYVDRGRIARYDDALSQAATSDTAPDVSQVRHDATKSGWAMNLEQQVANGIGWFARLSANDGQHEAFDFTDVNRSLATGLAIQGAAWNRNDDTVGVAVAVNALSSAARAYFAAGGPGILIGDGRLPNYGRERILESYYLLRVNAKLNLSADLQHISNPAYNRDRGPVLVYGVRLHAEF